MKYLIFFFAIGLFSCADSGEDDSGQVTTPVFSPAGGNYCADVDITIDTSTDGDSIYYKFGTGVTVSDTLYSGSFTITPPRTIYAIGIKDGMTNSVEASADYTSECLL